MTKPRLLLALALTAPLAPAVLTAQTPGYGWAVLETTSGTAPMAMGDAFNLAGSDSDGIFYNPASLARAEGFVLGFQRFRDAGTQVTASAATEWWNGRAGIGLQAMEWGGGTGAGESAGLGRILDPLSGATSEWAASVGYAQEIFGPSVGVVAKLLGRQGSGQRDVVGALDVGVVHELGPVWLGLTARNLSDGPLADDGAAPVPEEVTLGGGAGRFVLGPLDVGGAARLTRRADGDVDGGGGLEVAYWPVVGRTFIGRIGLQTEPYLGDDVALTFGAAFHGDDLVLEYAYRPTDLFGDDEGLHRVSIGWR